MLFLCNVHQHRETLKMRSQAKQKREDQFVLNYSWNIQNSRRT
jgi:hypothetical protein